MFLCGLVHQAHVSTPPCSLGTRGAHHPARPHRGARARLAPSGGRPRKFHRVPETKVGRRGGGGERVRVERECGLPRVAADRVRSPQDRGQRDCPGARAGTRGGAAAGARRGGAGPGLVGGAPGGRGVPSAQLPESLSPARAVARCFRCPGADRPVFPRSPRRSAPRVPALGVPAPRLVSTRRRDPGPCPATSWLLF